MFKLLVTKEKCKYRCVDCNSPAAYFGVYDTFACMHCDQWLDPHSCKSAEDCSFWEASKNMKEKPSQEEQSKIEFYSGQSSNAKSVTSIKENPLNRSPYLSAIKELFKDNRVRIAVIVTAILSFIAAVLSVNYGK